MDWKYKLDILDYNKTVKKNNSYFYYYIYLSTEYYQDRKIMYQEAKRIYLAESFRYFVICHRVEDIVSIYDAQQEISIGTMKRNGNGHDLVQILRERD